MPNEQPKSKPWYEQKTTWAAVLMIITAILPLLSDIVSPEQVEGIRTAVLAVAVICMRQGVEDVKRAIKY